MELGDGDRECGTPLAELLEETRCQIAGFLLGLLPIITVKVGDADLGVRVKLINETVDDDGCEHRLAGAGYAGTEECLLGGLDPGFKLYRLKKPPASPSLSSTDEVVMLKTAVYWCDPVENILPRTVELVTAHMTNVFFHFLLRDVKLLESFIDCDCLLIMAG